VSKTPFQQVTDDLTDGCGCACHTGVGYNSACGHCRPIPLTRDVANSVAEWGRPDRVLPTWRGRRCWQFPADLWRYAELCWELHPSFVVEVGTQEGGTALFLADVLDAIGHGAVIAIDVRPVELDHPRITQVWGDSTSTEVLHRLPLTMIGHRGLVLLDGSHASGHVEAELDAYAPLADYLVVEDTIMRWLPRYTGGPHNALDRWLPEHPEWRADPDPVPGPTQHPGGWLRRV
jgi:cephalosporin hydroxylase